MEGNVTWTFQWVRWLVEMLGNELVGSLQGRAWRDESVIDGDEFT